MSGTVGADAGADADNYTATVCGTAGMAIDVGVDSQHATEPRKGMVHPQAGAGHEDVRAALQAVAAAEVHLAKLRQCAADTVEFVRLEAAAANNDGCGRACTSKHPPDRKAAGMRGAVPEQASENVDDESDKSTMTTTRRSRSRSGRFR